MQAVQFNGLFNLHKKPENKSPELHMSDDRRFQLETKPVFAEAKDTVQFSGSCCG